MDWPGVNRTRVKQVALVLLALAVVATPVIYAYTTKVEVKSGARFETDSGLTVYFDEDRNITSGNPFVDSNTLRIEEDAGAANYSSTSGGRLRVQHINGSYARVDDVNATAGNITINPDGLAQAKVKGGLSEFNYTGEGGVGDDTVDFTYVAGQGAGTSTVTIETNGTDGTQYGAIDPSTDEGLAVGVADSSGTVTFDGLPGGVGTQDVVIKKLGTLEIRKENAPHGLVTGSTVTVKFFEDDDDANPTIVNRTDSDGDGKIDLTGLPVNEQFVVTAKASGYENRTAIIRDLSQQQSVFLVNTSETLIENRFTVTDQTGDFEVENTEIEIQKAINRSKYDSSADGYEWTTIAGDDLGADGAITISLIEGDRYRIRVQNEQGDTRILGAYTPQTAGTINLEIGNVVATQTEQEDVAWEANRTNKTGQPVYVNFEYNDTRNRTDTLYLEIYEDGNQSNVLLSNTSYQDLGTLSVTEKVPASENDTAWVVEFTAERTGAENIDGKRVVGPKRPLLPGMSDWVVAVIFTGLIWVVAGLFSQINGAVGGLVVAGLGGMLWFVDFIPNALGSGVIALAMITAGLLFINERRDGGL